MENIISSIFKFVKAMYVHVYTVYIIYVVNICLCWQSGNPIIRVCVLCVCVCVRACVLIESSNGSFN